MVFIIKKNIQKITILHFSNCFPMSTTMSRPTFSGVKKINISKVVFKMRLILKMGIKDVGKNVKMWCCCLKPF